ncbi:hypothetical protein [Muricomes intestini]|jgi:dihydroxyacetone kinase|uniref:hypothetical protein n=1 Tax=Muricomes intestini TaxID=1796634 RepID=UPI002FE149C3
MNTKKIINNPDNVISEMMEGFILANENYFAKHPEVNGVISRNPRKGKVALVIGGGSRCS